MAINTIKIQPFVRGVLSWIILHSKCCPVPYALLEAREDQDRKILRDSLYGSVCNRLLLCLHHFTVNEILLLVGW